MVIGWQFVFGRLEWESSLLSLSNVRQYSVNRYGITLSCVELYGILGTCEHMEDGMAA